jgi:hypothetical protein
MVTPVEIDMRPICCEVHLPGIEVYRFPWSLDREVGKYEPLPMLFPGEQAGDSEFTRFIPQEAAARPDRNAIIAKVQEFQSKATAEQREDDNVLLKFWGPSCVFRAVGEQTQKEWLFRQALPWGSRVPICEPSCIVLNAPEEEVLLSIYIESTVWSIYRWDGKCPVLKENVHTERKNAQLFADLISEIMSAYPEGLIEWQIEREHDPDLSGFIPEELEKKFGRQGRSVLVRETPGFTQMPRS